MDSPPAPAQPQPQKPLFHKQNPIFELLIIAGVTISVLFLLKGSTFFLNKVKNTKQVTVKQTTIKPLTSISQRLNSISNNNQMRFAFMRNGNIYLFDNEKEILLISPEKQSDKNHCYGMNFPSVSPNGQYLAYIEQKGDGPGEDGCVEGSLNIIDFEKKTESKTDYKIMSFQWRANNKIKFQPIEQSNQLKEGDKIITKQIYYDPRTGKKTIYEKVEIFEEIYGVDNETKEIVNRGIGDVLYSVDYPNDQETRLIRYKNGKYYLINLFTSYWYLLVDADQVGDFVGWSPDGRLALFMANPEEKTEVFMGQVWYIFDTDNIATGLQKTVVVRGAAGGSMSVGLQWYFNKGFISYCSQSLSFVNGDKPLELTNSGGGGCHNEDGFVATSPNGEYAIVKFNDRFELHNKNGDKIKINETLLITKSRFNPYKLIWLNNDFLIISERDFQNNKNKVSLFDRNKNTIEPLIENASI